MIRQYKNRPRDAAAEQIECYIHEHGLGAHEKLPSERDMCAMWGVNRTTLRSAIRRLSAEGVLYNRAGSGTFVAPEKLVCNLQDMRPISSMVAQAGRKLSTKLVRARLMECNKQLMQKLKRPLGHRIYELIRLRLIDDTPVLLETSYIDAVRFAGIERHDFSVQPLYHTLENEYGVAVLSGVEKLSITYTDESEAMLLGIPEKTAVILRSGVAQDESGVPVEYFKSIVRAEYIRFASVLTR